MTKRVTITADTFVPADTPDAAMQPVFEGTTLDLDDDTAGLLVVSRKARYDKDAKLRDTSKARMAEIDERATRAAADPQAAMMAAVAAAVAQAMQAGRVAA